MKVSFWDTAGQERYRAITKAYYRNANVVLLAFSFSLNLMIDNDWFLEISEMVPEDSLYFLVCTQIDRDNQGFTAAGMKNIPQKCNIPEFIKKKLGHVVFNVSAKEGWGIDVLKTEIARQCAEKFENSHVSFNSYSM
uniref:Uncharacterized protein n=1 Tax=Arcella intermedia TaxID=1963864 RepID=A0A6B2LJX3_9EUKA